MFAAALPPFSFQVEVRGGGSGGVMDVHTEEEEGGDEGEIQEDAVPVRGRREIARFEEHECNSY